jgi:hypothetical protein
MSVSRQCFFGLATDGKWYMQLGNDEHDWNEIDCTWYGPFDSQEQADDYRCDNFSNPGGAEIDDGGKMAPPKDCQKPQSSRFW